MARKAPSVATDDSQKENAGPGGRSQMKAEKAMNGKARGARSTRIESDEEDGQEVPETQVGEVGGDDKDDDFEEDKDADGEEFGEDADAEAEEDEEGAGSPKGRKRARANTMGDSHASESIPKQPKARIVTLPRGEDGFIPGSILRVQLKNFVTYDYVEFRPGPYLNMILGPNGTGKSSIACAICLGLNFPPSVLGRAADLNAFVKIGTETGHIEIELKGAKGKPNLVIKRTLSSRSKSSQFTLNGASASGKEINARMAELNVQVSNLCSFLPQDKVAEFARMSPQQLLKETQRAAGNEKLSAWHETLITSGKEFKQLQQVLTEYHEQLKTMEERNANLQRDVDRYNQRRAIEREIELLELILPFMEYTEARCRYEETKKKQRILLEKVKKIKEKNAPILAAKATLEQKFKELDTQREARKSATKKRFQTLGKKWAESEALENEAEELKSKLDNLKTAEKNRIKEIQRVESAIAKCKRDLENPPEVEDLDAINTQLKQSRAESAKIKDRFIDLQERQRACVDESVGHKREIDDHRQKLKDLDDVSIRKVMDLERWDRDCASTVLWLRNNRHRFKMEVLEPPIISVTVPDKRFTDAIEACFSKNQLKTIVAQCEEDYQLLNQLLVDTPEALGRKVRINTWYRAKGHLVPPPMSQDELRHAGFDGYALDYVQCPDGLRWFLQNALNLHRTAIAALNPNGVDPQHAMHMVSRVGPNGEGGGATYIVGRLMNSVSRSRYGNRLPQNMTRDIGPARNLVNTSVDPAIRQGHERKIAEAQELLKNCEAKIEELTKEDAEYQAQNRELKKQEAALLGRKNTVIETKVKLERTASSLVSHETKLKGLRNAPSVEAERGRLKTRILSLAKKRADIVKAYERVVHDAIKDQEESTRIGLEYLQIGANKAALQSFCQKRDTVYQQAVAEFKRAQEAYEEAKATSKLKLDVSKDKLDSVDEEVRARFRELESQGKVNERSAEEVKIELDNQRAQLEMNLHTNAGVVLQYEKRLAEIAKLKDVIEEKEEKLAKVEGSIKIARDSWEPALVDLVDSVGTKFSAAFDRMGRAGEIKISQHEDYDKWAIDIMVKFRDDEKLQLLTGERQSGGERSLTTILYLMSLTEEARAPFSLVDEINQGMDAEAERAVHDALVQVTCKQDSGQYFLITPKLLPDLTYHERMKVLCVNNGEWLPEDAQLGNMMSMIEGFTRHQSRANASA